jgi:hypothetical protein
MSERHIDEAIDAAVRDLMDVDADPAFRARVVERLRKPRPRLLWRQLSVGTAALILFAATVMMRPGTKPAGDQRKSRPSAPVAVSSQTVAAEPRPAPAPPPALPPRHAPRPRAASTTHTIERGAIVAAVADVGAGAIGTSVDSEASTLQPIAAIDLTPITHSPIVSPEVAITPLEPPSEIVIAPLEPRKERN